ncbi:MAG TPA: ATP-binding protein [Pyrinomonadaceae bacterium]|jgi:two-component system sensor histidine kinase CpxA
MNLFVKLFLWFLAAIALMVAVVMFITWTTQAEPVVRRWHTSVINQTNIYADTARQIYDNEGEKGLADFLDRVREADTIDEIGLINPKGEISHLDNLNKEIIQTMIGRALSSNNVETETERPEAIYAARTFTRGNGDRYVLFVQWDRPRPTPFFGEANYRYARLLGLFLTALALCYVFARYLSAPIVKLSDATKKLAAGNLQTRVAPEIGSRGDEIGKLAADFDEMAERIEALINSQKRLSRDVSHELRSPLARLNVALELAKQKGNAESQNLLDRIEREARQLNEMIAQILQLSRLESQSETIEREQINLRKLIERIVADANFEAESQNKKVVIAENADCEIYGNENLLRSAVENVLRNALRYTNDIVEVFLSKNKSEIVVKIKDYGKGVAEEELANLFTPFYRVSEARERKSGGAGLGLAIAEQAVTSHKGKITAKNAESGGLIVEIKLPYSAAHQQTISRTKAQKSNKPQPSRVER